MDWSAIGTQIIIGIIGALLSGLGILITYFINKFVKNDQLKNILNSLNNTVKNAVSETYQVYVQEVKEKGIFDKDAQNKALHMALETIKKNLPKDVEKWLKDNYDDIESFLKSLIEAQIGLLKNKN